MPDTAMHMTMSEAILREKQIKKWRRAWKVALIQRDNPEWRDLYDEIAGAPASNGFPLRGNDRSKPQSIGIMSTLALSGAA